MVSSKRNEARIARVKTEVSIVDLMISYGYPIHSGGREEQFSCDLHGDGRDNKPSGRLYPDSNSFYCFTCDKTRDTIELVREKESLDFWAAVKRLEQKFNLPPLPWLGDEEDSTESSKGIQLDLDRKTTFEDDLRRLTKFLQNATKDRDLPLAELLTFWEARDKLAWMVLEKQVDEKKAQAAAEGLRQRMHTTIAELNRR